MTNQDNLRDRIAELIEGLDDQQMIDDGFISSPNDIAQAIIDELGLAYIRTGGSIVGKWETQ